MYIRYKNQVDEKFYNPNLIGPPGFQSDGQPLTQSAAPALQHS